MRIVKQPKPRLPEETSRLREEVAAIIDDVRKGGDRALADYSRRFDATSRSVFRVSPEEIDEARSLVDAGLIGLMEDGAANIRSFAERQKTVLTELPEREMSPGVFLGHRVLPVPSCCCYVPGGGFPLFSTALMLALPARVAGVGRVVATTPVMKGTDRIHPATLTALAIAGVDEIYALGGAQAVAAFTWGTKQIRPVDMIVGPGNRYVTEAKRQCYGPVGIDFIAGPSEVLVIADGGADAELIAADLLAQSEHDLEARGIVVTDDEVLARAVADAVERRLAAMGETMARRAWEDNGEILVVDDLIEACSVADDYAPEHLELVVDDAEALVGRLHNYGALFVGALSAEVFGDYVAGPNHTLPTLRASRYTGGVWAGTFLKVCTRQRMTAEGVARLAPVAAALARAEGLEAHAAAAEVRLSR
ncbi:MAG: histidinol dehydrogenase [Synergistaceae bacterium]|nr:histidinol dehydrogenase [Synergistaceae bacterium]